MQTFDLQQIISDYQKVTTLDELDTVHRTYLGKDGSITASFKTLPTLSTEEKKTYGSILAQAKSTCESNFEEKKSEITTQQINAQLANEIIDIHMNGGKLEQGHYHILAMTRRAIEERLTALGFTIEYGHELVTTHENFETTNIPMTHPATDIHDTFYVDKTNEEGEKLLLRTQTTAHQQEMLRKYGPVCKVAIPGKVYRNEKKDATHDTMFWQLDGIVVDKGLSIAHFKSSIETILGEILERKVNIRLRPSYFPFTEPSFEIDVKVTPEDGRLRQLSKETGWIELLGAGMIHHKLLTMAGIDPEVYSGFAFGIGLTRLVAIKHMLHDVRLLTDNDLKFIQSF